MPHVCKTIIVSNPPPPLPNCATTRYTTVLLDKVNVKTSIMPCDVFQTRALAWTKPRSHAEISCLSNPVMRHTVIITVKMSLDKREFIDSRIHRRENTLLAPLY